MARASSPLHTGRDPPTSPPPPLPTETDPYFNAFSRHYSFSVKHSQTRNKLTGSTTPTTSPKKVAPPRVCARATSFSVSSTSSHSSVSSLGSLIGSPSVESFPRPPTPLLSPGYSGDLQSDPLPPPPFPGAVPTLPHPGKDVQLRKDLRQMRLVLKLVWLLMHLSLAFLRPDPGETPRTCGECAFFILLGGVGILFSFSNERWDPRNVPPGFDGRGSAVHSLWPKIALVANRRSCEILPVVWENFGTTIFLKPSQKSKVMALIHAKTNWRSLL